MQHAKASHFFIRIRECHFSHVIFLLLFMTKEPECLDMKIEGLASETNTDPEGWFKLLYVTGGFKLLYMTTGFKLLYMTSDFKLVYMTNGFSSSSAPT